MPLNSNERLQEMLSIAIEKRSPGYQDLVSNSNVIMSVLKSKGMWKPFSAPTIRERLLYNESGTYTRYSGYQFLNPKPVELVNDAEFTPKMAAVSVTLSGEDMLRNAGDGQLEDIMELHLSAAEQELADRFVEDVHGDGTADGGRQIGGMQLAIPTDPTVGTYGGISRATNPLWRTTTYDANSYFSGVTAITSATIKPIYTQIMIERSKGREGPDVILASQEHFLAFQEATEAIQRITDAGGVGKLGFTSLKFYGAGRSADITMEGGQGSAMPSGVTYFLNSKSLKFYYHRDRNFRPFGGKQMPVNQDAVVQHIGYMGELVLCNPRYVAKLYDSA